MHIITEIQLACITSLAKMNIFRFEVKSNPDVSKKITDSNASLNVNLVKVKRIIEYT